MADSRNQAQLEELINKVDVVSNNIVVCSTSGGDYTSLKEACDYVATQSPSNINRFSIQAKGGHFVEAPFAVPSFTNLDLSGCTVTPSDLTSDFIELSNESTIANFAVVTAQTEGRTIYGETESGIGRINSVQIQGGVQGFHSSNGALLAISDANTSGMTDGYTVDGGLMIGISTSANFCTNAMVLDNTGSAQGVGYSGFGNTYDIVQKDASSILRFMDLTVDASKISAVDWNNIYLTIASDEEDDEAFLLTQKISVGLPEMGRESSLGEGNSYTRGMLVYTYDGASYVDVTEAAKSASGSTFGFPNINIGTCIYMASSLKKAGEVIEYYGIKTKTSTPIVLGGGNLIVEYWNGSSWTNVNWSNVGANKPFIPCAKCLFEVNGSDQVRYNGYLAIDSWTKNDPMSIGTDYYWTRIRIENAITTSPVIEQLKLHSSCFEPNANGWLEYKGTARPIGRLPWDVGFFEKTATTDPKDQDLYLTKTIDVGSKKNKFEFSNAKAQRVGFKATLPYDLDTSTPIKFQWGVVSDSISGGDDEWILKTAHTQDGDDLFLSDVDAPASIANENAQTLILPAPLSDDKIKWYTAYLDVSDMVSRRDGGYGDTLWFSMERTRGYGHLGDISLVDISADYLKWCEGGHL